LHLRNLYAHLLENHYLEGLVGFNAALSDIFSRDVLARIQQGQDGWEQMVPPKVAELIKQRDLFGHQPAGPHLHPVSS
ncbi:MAG: TonB-dependent receptor, partial [Verrucomicrobia bacterium]|nr:TonB-dependent receptor [Verrucomicrobiota bacterium]